MLVLMFTACCSVGALTSCGDDSNKGQGQGGDKPIVQPESQEKFRLTRTALSVGIYEDFALTVEGDYKDEELTWTSSDETIATVKNGYVTTYKAGVVVITVSKGELSDQCTVTVQGSSMIPKIGVNASNKEVSLYEGLTFNLQPTLSYNQTEYVDFTVRYATENAQIATVDQDGLIVAVALGETDITLTVEWRGLTVNEIVRVNVISDKYISLNKTDVSIYLTDVDGYNLATTDKVYPTLNKLDGIIENVSFTVREKTESAENVSKVATCDNDGNISAVSLGTTQFEFVCEYEGTEYVSEAFNVTVNKFLYYLNDSFYKTYSTKGNTVNVQNLVNVTSLDKVTLDGEDVNASGSSFDVGVLERGSHEVVFTADGKVGIEYHTKLLIADTLISNVAELRAITNNAYNVLTADIDCGNGALTLGDFNGILDGNGHTIYNIVNSNTYGGIFMNVGSEAVIKNLGIYNYASTRGDVYNFALSKEFYGTIDNVSFHQTGSGKIGAMFYVVKAGCTINNFVVYANNVAISGYFNSVGPINGGKNVYIFANALNNTLGLTKWFVTGASGKDYLETDVYKEMDFKKIFDCSDGGMWEMDRIYGVPMIKFADRSYSLEGDTKTYKSADVVFEDLPFTDIGKVEVAGISIDQNDYFLTGNDLTITDAGLEILRSGRNTVVITSIDGKIKYTATIINDVYVEISTLEQLRAIANHPTGYYKLTADIDCGNGALNLGDFNGILDGNGHIIYNIVNSNTYGGIFMNVYSNAVIKNLGIYNYASTRDDVYNFALSREFHGTIDNVSFQQTGTGKIGAMFFQVCQGCTINNFVVYANNVAISGYFNSSGPINGGQNVYVFANQVNSTIGMTQFFATGSTGMGYLENETFAAIDFTTMFDCSENGMWEIDRVYKIPVIKSTNRTYSFTGETLNYEGENVTFDNLPFADVGKVEIAGVVVDEANYELNGNALTVFASYLQNIAKGENTVTITSVDGKVKFNAAIDNVVQATYYTVTFTDGANTLGLTKVREGETIAETPSAAAGCAYIWTKDGEAFDMTTAITGDITLVGEKTLKTLQMWSGSYLQSGSPLVKEYGNKEYNVALANETAMMKQTATYATWSNGVAQWAFDVTTADIEAWKNMGYLTVSFKVYASFPNGAGKLVLGGETALTSNTWTAVEIDLDTLATYAATDEKTPNPFQIYLGTHNGTQFSVAITQPVLQKAKVTVTYTDGENELGTEEVALGLTVANTPACTAGYVYTWSKDGVAFDLSTPITENITLVGTKTLKPIEMWANAYLQIGSSTKVFENKQYNVEVAGKTAMMYQTTTRLATQNGHLQWGLSVTAEEIAAWKAAGKTKATFELYIVGSQNVTGNFYGTDVALTANAWTTIEVSLDAIASYIGDNVNHARFTITLGTGTTEFGAAITTPVLS